MKVLILGQNPSKRGHKCGSHKRLYKWMDEWNLNLVSFDNVSQKFGRFNKKDVDSQYLAETCKGYSKILTLGRNAGEVLNSLGINHFGLPHPSGLNRKLNDKSYETTWVAMAKIHIQEGI